MVCKNNVSNITHNSLHDARSVTKCSTIRVFHSFNLHWNVSIFLLNDATRCVSHDVCKLTTKISFKHVIRLGALYKIGMAWNTKRNGTVERDVTGLWMNTEPSLITNYTTLLQVTVTLCSRTWIAGGISRNYIDNFLMTKKSNWAQHSSVHLCTMQFILLTVYKNTLCALISCLFYPVNWNWIYTVFQKWYHFHNAQNAVKHSIP